MVIPGIVIHLSDNQPFYSTTIGLELLTVDGNDLCLTLQQWEPFLTSSVMAGCSKDWNLSTPRRRADALSVELRPRVFGIQTYFLEMQATLDLLGGVGGVSELIFHTPNTAPKNAGTKNTVFIMGMSSGPLTIHGVMPWPITMPSG